MKSMVLFVLGSILFGTVALGFGYAIWSEDALLQGGAAFALAFFPALGTLAWVMFSYRTDPELRLMASLGSSGVRMAVALGGGYFLTRGQPEIFGAAFWSWLVLFYLGFLGLEITLLVQQGQKLTGTPQTCNKPS